MRLSKVLFSVVFSILFLSPFFGICQAGELDGKERFKRIGLGEKRDNPSKMVSKVEPFLSERWRNQSFEGKNSGTFLPDTNVNYVSSILWTVVKEVQVVGNYAYCAFVNGLVILDVSDPANPSFVSKLYFQGGGEGIFVQGNYVYLAERDAGLIIIDASDPANPTLAGSYNTPGTTYGVFVQNSLAYVADGSSGLQIVDVSDPANPTLAGSYNTPGQGFGVFVADTLAYVADSWSGLQIINVSNPANPTLAGSYNTPGKAYGVFVQNSLAYVADGSSGLQIVDVSDPANPTLAGSYNTPDEANGVFVENSLAYVTNGYGLEIIDVSDPANATLLGSFINYWGFTWDIFVMDGLAYLASSGESGLLIISVSDPTNPNLVGGYRTPGSAWAVFLSSTLAYVADRWGALHIINVSDPANPGLVGSSHCTSFSMGGADVFVQDSLAYVVDDYGLWVINVTDPATPNLMGSFDTPGQGFGVFVADTLAYVADTWSGLQIINVSDPANPTLAGSYNTPGTAYGVFVQNSLAYVADGSSGLQIVDVSDPANPTLAGSYNTPDEANGVFVQNSLAYVADHWSGLQIIDVSDPANPFLAGSYNTSGYANGVFVQNGLAYVADWGGGLQIIYVSDPANPGLTESYTTPGFTADVFVQDSLVYLADWCSLIILKTSCGGGPKTLVLKDGSASHNPISNKSFKIYKVTNDPPNMTEDYLGELTTDGNGKITLPEGWFNEGEWVKVEKLVHTQLAVKHLSVLPYMYNVKLDNGKFDTGTGAISYHPLGCEAEQEVIVDHTTIVYDLLVSVEWDADQQYLQSLSQGLRRMSNYLYDVSDGQIYLNTVLIYDNRQNWEEADMQVFASNVREPWSDIDGMFNSSLIPWSHIYMPRKWFRNVDDTRNATVEDESLDLAYSDDFRTKAHELGHYALGFGDEYKFCYWGVPWLGDRHCTHVSNYGFMGQHLWDYGAYSSEMSSDSKYVYEECQNTVQYCWTNPGASCWADFETQFEKSYPDLFASIIKPSERTLPPDSDYFPGPNDRFDDPIYPQPLNCDVGDLLAPEIEDYDGGARTVVVSCYRWFGGQPIPKVSVSLSKGFWRPTIYQGMTADAPNAGKIRCLGYNDGDVIRASGRTKIEGKSSEEWFFGEGFLARSDLSSLQNLYRWSSDGDSLDLFLRAVEGDHPLIFATSLSTGTPEYILYATQPFPADPTLDLHPDYEPGQSYPLTTVPGGYSALIPDDMGNSGRFTLLALDDSLYTFFVNTPYSLTDIADTSLAYVISGPQGGCELLLDTLISDLEEVLILSSSYPPIRSGLDSQSEQAGEIYSISSYPAGILSGSNSLIIHYADSDLENQSEATLEIFRWNESLGQWEELCGSIDPVNNLIGASINSLGVYGAFTAGYLRGDANGDSVINIGDVVYLVNYLYRGHPAPDPVEAGDANCDGVVDIGDVVYLINYLFRQGPQPCQ